MFAYNFVIWTATSLHLKTNIFGMKILFQNQNILLNCADYFQSYGLWKTVTQNGQKFGLFCNFLLLAISLGVFELYPRNLFPREGTKVCFPNNAIQNLVCKTKKFYIVIRETKTHYQMEKPKMYSICRQCRLYSSIFMKILKSSYGNIFYALSKSNLFGAKAVIITKIMVFG